MINHAFTQTLMNAVEAALPGVSKELFQTSPLLQYINTKTASASRGSKSRGSFANLYAIYVLVEDYIAKGFNGIQPYKDYEGARFSTLFDRQRELPFGAKLQNHAFNSRLNEEFKKYFPLEDRLPIIRDVKTNRYWFNESLLKVTVNGVEQNISTAVIAIIEAYIDAKRDAFDRFLVDCKAMLNIEAEGDEKVVEFIVKLLEPNVDARVFEIVSYAILKALYASQSIYWGWAENDLQHEFLVLYKTGRTNANDGGIDFVMKPLGRFFQVTETVDARKYFLDIDKVQRFPVTFVVKTSKESATLLKELKEQATKRYAITAVVERYMTCVEEIINIPGLLAALNEVNAAGNISDVIDEIVLQSKVEFNYTEDEEGESEEPELAISPNS